MLYAWQAHLYFCLNTILSKYVSANWKVYALFLVRNPQHRSWASFPTRAARQKMTYLK